MSDFNQAKYIQQFQKEKYDRCIFNVPKGQKAIIDAHWKLKGYKSLNAYVNTLIKKDMENDKKCDNATVNIDGVNNGIIATGGANQININK